MGGVEEPLRVLGGRSDIHDSPAVQQFHVPDRCDGLAAADAVFVLEEQFDPSRFWNQIAEHDATVFLYLSRMLSVLQNQDAAADVADTPAELAIGHSFGFATDDEMFRNFEDRFDVTVLEGYGVTPATIATYNRPSDRRLGSVGTEASYVELEIVDSDDWPVPTGETGEIVVRPTRPNTMMKQYHENPPATREAFRNQWLHTGGIGYKDEDGYLHFIANRDNSIYRGRVDGRISSLEIESFINAQPGVRQSTVVGVRNERGNEEIKALVVPEDGTDITPIDVCKRCEQQLPYQGPAIHRTPRRPPAESVREGPKAGPESRGDGRRLGPEERLRTQPLIRVEPAISLPLRRPLGRLGSATDEDGSVRVQDNRLCDAPKEHLAGWRAFAACEDDTVGVVAIGSPNDGVACLPAGPFRFDLNACVFKVSLAPA